MINDDSLYDLWWDLLLKHCAGFQASAVTGSLILRFRAKSQTEVYLFYTLFNLFINPHQEKETQFHKRSTISKGYLVYHSWKTLLRFSLSHCLLSTYFVSVNHMGQNICTYKPWKPIIKIRWTFDKSWSFAVKFVWDSGGTQHYYHFGYMQQSPS